MGTKRGPPTLPNEAPCDDCAMQARCGKYELACRRYGRYMHARDWRKQPKGRPTHARWLRIMALT